tara:strand:- start:131 stop:394 length:264 start_codon:yes stop_codon:yes gene_type:complete
MNITKKNNGEKMKKQPTYKVRVTRIVKEYVDTIVVTAPNKLEASIKATEVARANGMKTLKSELPENTRIDFDAKLYLDPNQPSYRGE